MKLIDFRSEMPRHPTRKWKKRSKVKRIVIHTTASDNQDPKKTARYHITPSKNNHLSRLGAPGLAYTDFITKCGVVYHCNDYDDVTWHCRGWNKTSVGVCMAFRGQDDVEPSDLQWNAMIQHVVRLCLYLKVVPNMVKGHREAPSVMQILGNGSIKYKKSCPGWAINLDHMRSEITIELQKRLRKEGLYLGPIDGLFGSKSKAALKAFSPTEVCCVS